MRTPLITGSLAVVATTALIGLGDAAVAAEPTTTHETGIVLECTGTIKGRAVYASLYENNTHGNTLQILVGDDAHQVGGSRDSDRAFLDRGEVRASMKVGGKRAVIAGAAERVGKRIAVHEEHDDAGEHITIDGFHRRLAVDLDLTWRGTTVPLDCAEAFAYDLRVTKEPTI